MTRDDVLARASFPAQRLEPMPVAGMFTGDQVAHRIGFKRQDDYDLDEMIGADTQYYDNLPPPSASMAKMRWGVREVVALVKQDNINSASSSRDQMKTFQPAEYYGQPIYPL